ncbi:MAG TPA: hypothetical protein VGI10_12610 [Polyangiaceae bacterium]|jgi:hypothetical protein
MKLWTAFTRKLVSRAVIIAGLLPLLAYASRWVPREQTLVFELPASTGVAARFSATWRHSGEREPLGGATWTFESPPNRVTYRVSLPDGDYVVNLELSSTDSAQAHEGVQTSWERRVTLRAGETVLVVAPNGS